MQAFFKKIINILKVFFKHIFLIILQLIGFFIPKKKTKETPPKKKPIKNQTIKNNRKINEEIIPDEPNTKSINKDTIIYKKLIKEIYCNLLDIKPLYLNSKELLLLTELEQNLLPHFKREETIKKINPKALIQVKVEEFLVDYYNDNKEKIDENPSLFPEKLKEKLILTPNHDKNINEENELKETNTTKKKPLLFSKLKTPLKPISESENKTKDFSVKKPESKIETASINIPNKPLEDKPSKNTPINYKENPTPHLDISTPSITPPNINIKPSIFSPLTFITPKGKKEKEKKEKKALKKQQKLETEKLPSKDIDKIKIRAVSVEPVLDLDSPLTKESITEIEEKAEKVEKPKKLFDKVDFKNIDISTEKLDYILTSEINKDNLEDKNYELIEERLDLLLLEIYKLKNKKLDANDLNKLKIKEAKLNHLKLTLNDERYKDIEKERKDIQADIRNSELSKLEQEIKNIYLENIFLLQKYNLNQIEELTFIEKNKAREIEKELIKTRLKKAYLATEFSSILALPFIRNKYFLFFTMGLIANHHLKFFNSILGRKTVEYEPDEIDHIKKGYIALEDASYIFKENINYLNYLEEQTLRKYPELNYDNEFLVYLDNLKSSLRKHDEKLTKKKKLIEKYHLKNKIQIRKLKKKNDS